MRTLLIAFLALLIAAGAAHAMLLSGGASLLAGVTAYVNEIGTTIYTTEDGTAHYCPESVNAC